ncbi:TIR domain-containing protein [Spirochaeta dissipatitropha]
MIKSHKVFVSFHHFNDEEYRKKFIKIFSDFAEVIIDQSVGDGDIDPDLKTETIRQKIRDEYLRNSTVTIVLIGTETWKKKHVDWEISSSLRDTQYNKRSGLIGLLLPTRKDYSTEHFDPYTIPPRLYDNVRNKFAKIYNWTESPQDIQRWVHAAFLDKDKIIPDNSRDIFRNNRSGSKWE